MVRRKLVATRALLVGFAEKSVAAGDRSESTGGEFGSSTEEYILIVNIQ